MPNIKTLIRIIIKFYFRLIIPVVSSEVCLKCQIPMKIKAKDIAAKIRELRKSLKLTQNQFSELVDLSEDSVGKIERGLYIPTVETLNKIAIALKIPIENLISPIKKRPAQNPPEALDGLIAYLQTRSPDDIRFIHELAVKILERKK